MQRQHPHSRLNISRRQLRVHGFTLVELMIVCGLLAAIAAISWPSVRNSLAKSRLKKAASDIRTTFGRTRNDAIQKGQSFIVRYEMDGRKYRIERWTGRDPAEIDELDAVPDNLTDEPSFTGESSFEEELNFEPIEKELPEGVRFLSGDDASLDSLNERLTSVGDSFASDEFLPSRTPESTEWSEPVVFHANGRTDNARLRIINQRDFFIDLSLRGLTGIVTSTPPARMLNEDEGGSLLNDGADISLPPTEARQP